MVPFDFWNVLECFADLVMIVKPLCYWDNF